MINYINMCPLLFFLKYKQYLLVEIYPIKITYLKLTQKHDAGRKKRMYVGHEGIFALREKGTPAKGVLL